MLTTVTDDRQTDYFTPYCVCACGVIIRNSYICPPTRENIMYVPCMAATWINPEIHCNIILHIHIHIHCTYINILFIRILATATINFSLAGVQLLIKGGSYLGTVFINLERHLLVTLTQQTQFSGLISNVRLINKQQNQAKDLKVSAMFLPRTSDRAWLMVAYDHAHLIVFAHACGHYSRAATISFVGLHVRLLFEGGY